MDNRRRNVRIRVPLSVEFMPIKGTDRYISGKTINFSREGMSFTSDSVESEPTDPIMIKFKLLKEFEFIYAKAVVVWKKQVSDKFCVGVKINAIDKESRSGKLNFPFNMWLENQESN